MAETLLTENRDGVLIVTFNRPIETLAVLVPPSWSPPRVWVPFC